MRLEDLLKIKRYEDYHLLYLDLNGDIDILNRNKLTPLQKTFEVMEVDDNNCEVWLAYFGGAQ